MVLAITALSAALSVFGTLLEDAAAGHAHASPPDAARAAEQALAAYERFQSLEGKWRGKSTRGWEEESSYRVIAGGSAVLGTSFDAHPGETMATLFYLNDGVLELTHYCVAKNAPHLRATKITEDGRSVEFTFVDGVNLSNRNRGHMDRAVYRFLPDGRVTARWTWYQDGHERWMEEIELVRIAAAAGPSAWERK